VSLTAGLSMTWHDLLLAHWPISMEVLRPHVPAGLEVETFDGTAWLTVVPFRMTHVRPFGLWLPGEQFAFAEVNLRTYVCAEGQPGVWFLSLDGGHAAAALAARAVFGVDYRHAEVRARREGHEVRFSSRRRGPRPAVFEATYGPSGEAGTPAPGSLDAFLTDRLSLFGIGRGGGLSRARVEHPPWILSGAEAEILANTLAASMGISLPGQPALLHFARRIEVVGRRPLPLHAGRGRAD
jgi:uncharacterized protein YqjF (DUF2071 family)